MATVSPKKNYDPSKVNRISEKLMDNPEIASLIGMFSSLDGRSQRASARSAADLGQCWAASRDGCPFGL